MSQTIIEEEEEEEDNMMNNKKPPLLPDEDLSLFTKKKTQLPDSDDEDFGFERPKFTRRGSANLPEVNEETFDMEFEEHDGVDSVGDLLTQLAGQIPIAGSVIVFENLRFKILAANDRRVIRVSIEAVEIEHDDEDQ